MIDELAQKIMDEIFPHLETIETQSAAILELLKDRGIATEQELAPYLEQAGRASNVRWLTTRLRIEHTLSQMKWDLEKAHEAKPEPAPHPEEKTAVTKESTEGSAQTPRTVEGAEDAKPGETDNKAA